MANSDRFLNAFNKIQKTARKITNSNSGVVFSELIALLAKKSLITKNQEWDLREFADLRNAIVHERTDEHVLAEPNDRTVKEIERLSELLQSPPGIPHKFIRSVFSCQTGDSIGAVLSDMYKKSFSQVPVYSGMQFKGLLTSNTIARWLGASVEADIFSLKETQIGHVVSFVENGYDNYVFVKRDVPLPHVVASFQEYSEKGQNLDAMLITHNGQSNTALLGIITVWDLPKFMQAF